MQFYTKYYFPFCMIFLIVGAGAKKGCPFGAAFYYGVLIDVFRFCRVVDYRCRYNFEVVLIELVEFTR